MKLGITVRIAIVSILLTFLLFSCVGEQGSGGGGQQTSPGTLYISNFGAGTLLIYGNAADANGNLAPTKTVQALNAQSFIMNPTAIFVDTVNDRLYAANTGLNQILIYDNASTINGNAVPDRVISGAATTLNFPRGLTVDTTNDTLYVANSGSNAILVFDVSAFTGTECTVSGPTTTCNFVPVQSITGINGPWGLFVDSFNDRLYAASAGQNSILVFDNASNNATLDRTITFSSATSQSIPYLSNPSGVFVDTVNNRLYAANYGSNSILIFDNADTIDGETIPDRAVSGAETNLSNPASIFVDVIADPDGNAANGTGVIYVANGSSILSFNNASIINTKVTDSGTSSGGNTSTTLNDTTKSFTADQFAGFTVDITGGPGQGQSRSITANTATQLTVSPAWTTTPTNTSTYQIRPSLTPSSTISGAATTLSSPAGIYVDTGSNQLYAANSGKNSFVVFNNASTTTGNIAPDRTITDAGVPLSFPGGVAVDVTRDLLYVGKTGSIDIFENASAMQNPPVAETVDISPLFLIFPFALTVDSTRDRLYAASLNSILIFDNASALTGNPAPDATIPGLTNPVGLALDSSRDLLYIAETTSNSVKVYSQAGTSPALLNTITGPDLVGIRAVAVDSPRNILYVASVNSILVYDAASTQNGAPTPDRIITGGATLLSAPQGIFIDSSNNFLYVANSGANSVLVFNNANAADGNIAPSRAIAQGADPIDETTLNVPLGISVDTTR